MSTQVSVRRRSPSASIQSLLAEYSEITINDTGRVLVGKGCLFVQAQRDPDVPLPAGAVSHVSEGIALYFIVPEDFEAGDIAPERIVSDVTVSSIVHYGVAHVVGGEWPSDETIAAAIRAYDRAVADAIAAREKAKADAIAAAKAEREAAEATRAAEEQAKQDAAYAEYQEQLKRERDERLASYNSSDSIFAGAWTVSEDARHLVRDLMPDGTVCVIYGGMNEFKTTLMYDLSGSLSLGCKFLDFDIALPRPVVFYALEGDNEAAERIKAVAAKLARHNPLWGTDCPPPIILRTRIPETDFEWRAELHELAQQCREAYFDRSKAGSMPLGPQNEYGTAMPLYPMPGHFGDDEAPCTMPIVVVDTLSMALAGGGGGKDSRGEIGVAATIFVHRCLELMKPQPDMIRLDDEDANSEELRKRQAAFDKRYPDARRGEYGSCEVGMPAASAVFIIHHPTKGGDTFGGHRTIAADTGALYRVHRAGSVTQHDQPMTATLTAIRTKAMAKPRPVRFEVEVVPIPGLESGRGTVILKDVKAEVPKALAPLVPKLAEIEADGNGLLSRADINSVLDGLKKSREMRNRYFGQLVDAGVLEPVAAEDETVIGYRLHI